MADWPDFRPNALLRELAARGVDFVVVGGMAVIAHGSARLTRDLDICFAGDSGNLDALGATLTALDARLRGVPEDVPFVADAQTLRQVRLLTLDTREGPIDVHAELDGAPRYEHLRRRADRIDLTGVAVLVASIEDLISMKEAAGRPQDLADVEELEAIRRLRRRVSPPETD